MPKRLLVADDSATIQRVVKYSLGQEDVEIVFVRTAEEAYTKSRELRPDLLIVDTVMPGKSGYDLSRALKNDAAMSATPILLLASANEAFDENKARASGANGWLPKPFQSQALIDQVRNLLSAGPAAARPAQRPTQPPPARPSAAPPPRPAGTQPPPVRPSGVVPGARPPAARPGATMPPAVRPPPAPGTRPPPARPAARPGMAVAPGTRPPPPRPAGTMPPAARPPAPPAARPQPPAPGPVAAGRGPAPAPAKVTPSNHEALLREALTTATKDMLEKVIWEVVPELAETIIREELERLIKAKQSGQ